MFSACVVIPVYDHEHAIGAVVDSMRAQGLPVLLVDDGCSEPCRRKPPHASFVSSGRAG